MRIAALDLGSNSFHLLVADVHPDGTFEAVAREKEMLRLGDDVTGSHRISQGLADRSVDTMRTYKQFADALGATEMLGMLVTGEIWLKVPHTIAMEFDGAFAPGVSAKDAMLFLIGRFGLDGGQYQAVEYRGAAIRKLPMSCCRSFTTNCASWQRRNSPRRDRDRRYSPLPWSTRRTCAW